MNKKIKAQSPEQISVKERLEFEKLLAGISARFVALPFDCVDTEILDAMKKLTSFFRVDGCGLMKLQPGKTLYRISHAYDSTGPGPIPIGIGLLVSVP